jgi:demethylmenaquinone methyltransferase/2-methoxy-6-polyprenyl-1,4-benzoquinol methylase
MPAYVLMKAFENAPARYDAAMDLLTLGRISAVKREIAGMVRDRGGRALELGCGAGSLAVLLARAGAEVLALDSSEAMLEVARKRAAEGDVADRIEFRELSLMEIDSLPEGSFDLIASTLVLSELSPDEVKFVLNASQRLLAPGGQILIADEAALPGRLARWGYALLRLPLQLATYLIGQANSLRGVGWARTALYFAIELPLMLLVFFFVPPTSRPLANVEGEVERAGFRLLGVRSYLGGTLKLVHAAASHE